MKGDFLWAVEQMKQGNQVKRYGWDSYWEMYKKECCIQSVYNGKLRNAEISIELIEATNWEIVDDKRTLYEKRYNDYEFHLKDVQAAIKEFIVDLNLRDAADLEFFNIEDKAKEIFGDDLID